MALPEILLQNLLSANDALAPQTAVLPTSSQPESLRPRPSGRSARSRVCLLLPPECLSSSKVRQSAPVSICVFSTTVPHLQQVHPISVCTNLRTLSLPSDTPAECGRLERNVSRSASGHQLPQFASEHSNKATPCAFSAALVGAADFCSPAAALSSPPADRGGSFSSAPASSRVLDPSLVF